MKKFFAWLITVGILCTVLFYKEEIFSYVLVKIIYPNEFVVEDANEYDTKLDYIYVQNTDDFTPENKQELMNIFYTILNSGWDSFSFVCDLSYENCISDIEDLLNDDYQLSNLNNFVHPYNSYKEISISVNNFGRVDVMIEKLYTEEEIKIIDTEIDRIYNTIITADMTQYDKIKTIHDYIVENTKYIREDDTDENGNLLFPLGTNKAYGLLVNHAASCGGYTDAMALFLYKMGIQNYKVSSTEHIWNLVYIDGVWKHLDLTWDDPVTNTGEDILTYNFFLITTQELLDKNVAEHDYDSSIFIEAKSN